MRILSIRIDSYSALRDKSLTDLDPGLNLFYGKNESGKTTLMEFVRSTMFFNKKREPYPKPQKTDSGEIRFLTDDGSELIIKREQKTSTVTKGAMPEKLGSMDYAKYSSVFAMTPDDLRNAEALSDIKSRFLTIPGGEMLPSIIADIDDSMTSLISNEKMTYTKGIGYMQKKEKDLKEQVSESRSKSERYITLHDDLNAIEEQISELTVRNRAFVEAQTNQRLQESQEKNVQDLRSLENTLKGLEASKIIKDDSKSRYERLKYDCDTKTESYNRLQNRAVALSGKLDGADPETILENSDSIRRLGNSISYHSELLHRKETPVTKPAKNGPLGYILIAGGVVILGICAIIGQYIGCAGGAALAAIGAMISFRKKRMPEGTQPKQQSGELQRLNAELDRVARAVGIGRESFQSDVEYLMLLLDTSKQYADVKKDADVAKIELDKTAVALNLFLSEFGGEERFNRLLTENEIRKTTETRISQLKDTIERSGYDPAPIDTEGLKDLTEEINALNIQKGSIEAEMKNIIDEERTNSLLVEEHMASEEILKMVREWGVLSIASNLIDSACDEFYDTVQPGVISTADRYIGLMTEGKYRLDSDPRNKDVAIMTDDGRKTSGQWSTGLGDQVRLSLKMSVAKEMTTESLPIILDDVLLTFDSDRKAGACKALADLSKDMQILFFTCDSETRELMERIGGCKTTIL